MEGGEVIVLVVNRKGKKGGCRGRCLRRGEKENNEDVGSGIC